MIFLSLSIKINLVFQTGLQGLQLHDFEFKQRILRYDLETEVNALFSDSKKNSIDKK
jgi:hypothetical protein